MNPILEDMYSTVLPSAPYLIAAYAIVWLVLLVYVIVVIRGLRKTEAQMAVLEEAIARQSAEKADLA